MQICGRGIVSIVKSVHQINNGVHLPIDPVKWLMNGTGMYPFEGSSKPCIKLKIYRQMLIADFYYFSRLT